MIRTISLILTLATLSQAVPLPPSIHTTLFGPPARIALTAEPGQKFSATLGAAALGLGTATLISAAVSGFTARTPHDHQQWNMWLGIAAASTLGLFAACQLAQR